MPPAASPPRLKRRGPPRLKQRAEFLAVAQRGRKQARGPLLVQALPQAGQLRVGFTATRKLGNAVTRNRAKRRMREIARLEFGTTRQGFDIVMIAREGVTTAPFASLRQSFRDALARLDVPC